MKILGFGQVFVDISQVAEKSEFWPIILLQPKRSIEISPDFLENYGFETDGAILAAGVNIEMLEKLNEKVPTSLGLRILTFTSQN